MTFNWLHMKCRIIIFDQRKNQAMLKKRYIRIFYGMLLVVLLAGCSRTQSGPALSLAQKITWLRSGHPYGHTCIRLKVDGQMIYLDPVDLIGVEDLPKADIILITHTHVDHFSPATIAALSKAATIVLCGDSAVIGQLPGIAQVLVMEPGQQAKIGTLPLEILPAYGSVAHPAGLQGLGYLLSAKGVRLYFSGDTGLTPEILSLKAVDIAVLNVRKPYCLSGEEVVEFVKAVRPEIVIPIHWMPGNDTWGDEEQIETIRQQIPGSTRFMVLELK